MWTESSEANLEPFNTISKMANGYFNCAKQISQHKVKIDSVFKKLNYLFTLRADMMDEIFDFAIFIDQIS